MFVVENRNLLNSIRNIVGKNLSLYLSRSTYNIVRAITKTTRVVLTYNCNFTCKFCYARGLMREFSSEMQLDDFIKVLKWSRSQGRDIIRFLGGEPTIYCHFLEALKICRKEKFIVELTTNNLFDEDVLEGLDSSFISGVDVNYSVLANIEQANEKHFKERFIKNLKGLNTKHIPIRFSYILDSADNNWQRMIEDAIIYKVKDIRISLPLPDLSEKKHLMMSVEELRFLAKRAIEIMKLCREKKIISFLYRAEPRCMFTADEKKYLEKINRNIFYTCCPIGHKGDYSVFVVVNPDLSIFPCSAIFIKGPSILYFKNNKEISNFYKRRLEKIMLIPTMDICKDCLYFERYKSAVLSGHKQRSIYDFANRELCQGGCLSFKSLASATKDLTKLQL